MHALPFGAGALAFCVVFVLVVWVLISLATRHSTEEAEKPSHEAVRLAEREVLDVTRNTVNQITIPLIRLLIRQLAVDRGELGEYDDVRSVPNVVNLFLGDYLEALDRSPPLARLAALEAEVEILQEKVRAMLMEDKRFCMLQLLLQIDECRSRIEIGQPEADKSLVARAFELGEEWKFLEQGIYDLAHHVELREAPFRMFDGGESEYSGDSF